MRAIKRRDTECHHTWAVDPAELTDRTGVHDLKRRIATYWILRGVDPPMFTLIQQTFNMGLRCSRVDLRSDMINGLPRSLLKAKGAAND